MTMGMISLKLKITLISVIKIVSKLSNIIAIAIILYLYNVFQTY